MFERNCSTLAVFLLVASVTGIETVSGGAPPESSSNKQAPSTANANPSAEQSPALNGYCPVSYHLETTPVGGDPALHVMYRNKLYYLANEEAKQKFIVNPERFVPRLDGLCTTALGGPYGNRFDGDPTVYSLADDRLYLFSSERAKRAYETRAQSVIARAEELFATPRLGGICVVSYLKRKEAIQGRLDTSYPYRHWTYHFAGKGARSDFMKDPQKYLPQYDSFCAESVSRGLLYPSDPKRFVVYDGKTYLFYSEETQIKFQTNPQEVIKKADEEWKTLKNRRKPDPGR